MDDTLKSQILAYIESHSVCRIAVSDGDRPSAHTVYYVNKGLHLYFETDPDSQKVHILRANDNISLTIDENYADWREIKGIQLFGKAKILGEHVTHQLREEFGKKFPLLADLGGIPRHHILVEVIPEKIYYLDFTKKFGNRSLYYPDEDSKSDIHW